MPDRVPAQPSVPNEDVIGTTRRTTEMPGEAVVPRHVSVREVETFAYVVRLDDPVVEIRLVERDGVAVLVDDFGVEGFDAYVTSGEIDVEEERIGD